MANNVAFYLAGVFEGTKQYLEDVIPFVCVTVNRNHIRAVKTEIRSLAS